MLRFMKVARQVVNRQFSSSTCRQVDNKVPINQKLFQEDNGVPVHLKGGPKDFLLFAATMALTVFGSGYVIYELFQAAMPKKKE